jgi:hypothetical protein
MGSKPRKSKPPREPVPPRAPSAYEAAEQALQETRSIFACAARCLDEVIDPSQLEAPEEFDASDIVVIVRLGIQRLNDAREALDRASAS